MVNVADETLYLGLEQLIQAWARSLEIGGREPEGHTYRVAELTMRFARKLGIPDSEIVHMVRGALLHDLGKIAVPDQLLMKPGKLDPAERALVEQHPLVAKSMLQTVEILRDAIDIPYCHHERWDGKGYPRGLRNEQIPLAARIFALVDVYDSLSHDQAYRAAWTQEEVVSHIRENSGKHFDPKLVEPFLMLVEGAVDEAVIEPSAKPVAMLLRAVA